MTTINNILLRLQNQQQNNGSSSFQLPNQILSTPIPNLVTPLELVSPINNQNSTLSTTSSPVSSPSSSSIDSNPESEQDDRRPHQCPDCLKRFRFKSNLFEHKTLHQPHSNFVCPFCSKTCRLKGNLKKHLQTHVPNSEALEQLWKARFSRSSGRPRKQLPNTTRLHPQQLPAPLANYAPISTDNPPVIDFRQALLGLNSLLNINMGQNFYPSHQ